MKTILKDPAASFAIDVGFTDLVASIDEVEIAPRGLVPGATPIAIASSIVSGLVHLVITEGTDGERYDVVIRVTAGASDLERAIAVACIDPLYTMADGTAAWLSILEFVQKVGLDEAVAATDADGSGAIDRDFLIGALRDAQGECSANLAGRYTLPLSVVPDILKTAVADLARARLYPRGMPDGVDAAAKAQRANLKRIAEGSMPLPGVAGVAVEQEATSDAPVEYHSGGRAYPDGLAGY